MPADAKTHSEKTLAGLRAAALQGRMPGRPVSVTDEQLRAVIHLRTGEAASRVGLSKHQYIARRRRLETEPGNG